MPSPGAYYETSEGGNARALSSDHFPQHGNKTLMFLAHYGLNKVGLTTYIMWYVTSPSLAALRHALFLCLGKDLLSSFLLADKQFGSVPWLHGMPRAETKETRLKAALPLTDWVVWNMLPVSPKGYFTHQTVIIILPLAAGKPAVIRISRWECILEQERPKFKIQDVLLAEDVKWGKVTWALNLHFLSYEARKVRELTL